MQILDTGLKNRVIANPGINATSLSLLRIVQSLCDQTINELIDIPMVNVVEVVYERMSRKVFQIGEYFEWVKYFRTEQDNSRKRKKSLRSTQVFL